VAWGFIFGNPVRSACVLPGSYVIAKKEHAPTDYMALMRVDRFLGLVPVHHEVVGPTVWKAEWNDDFIIARQHSGESPEDRTAKWYVLRVKDDTLFGPFSAAELQRERQRLGVSATEKRFEITVTPVSARLE
jgi:hypothetical protein